MKVGIVGRTFYVPLPSVRGTLRDKVRAALWNIDNFDRRPEQEPDGDFRLPDKSPREQSLEWLAKQSEDVRRVAKKYPLDRLYRLKKVDVTVTSAPPSILVVIVGWRRLPGGIVALCQVVGLPDAVQDQPNVRGTAANPLLVPPSALEDVTEAARAGTLAELRDPHRIY